MDLRDLTGGAGEGERMSRGYVVLVKGLEYELYITFDIDGKEAGRGFSDADAP
jgi:predicted RNA-binding protein with TRAM domain